MDSFDWQKKGFVILVDEKASNISTVSDAKCFKCQVFVIEIHTYYNPLQFVP